MSIEQKTFNTPNEHQVHLLTVDTLTKGKKMPPTGWWCTMMSNNAMKDDVDGKGDHRQLLIRKHNKFFDSNEK